MTEERRKKLLLNVSDNCYGTGYDPCHVPAYQMHYVHGLYIILAVVLRRRCQIAYIAASTRSSADADNRLDAFSGQSRSTNMVPFHMLHIVSYCAIVTLSLRRSIFAFKKNHDLEMGSKVTQSH